MPGSGKDVALAQAASCSQRLQERIVCIEAGEEDCIKVLLSNSRVSWGKNGDG
jgi:hypothetical protein